MTLDLAIGLALLYPFSYMLSTLLMWPYWWAYDVLIEERII